MDPQLASLLASILIPGMIEVGKELAKIPVKSLLKPAQTLADEAIMRGYYARKEQADLMRAMMRAAEDIGVGEGDSPWLKIAINTLVEPKNKTLRAEVVGAVLTMFRPDDMPPDLPGKLDVLPGDRERLAEFLHKFRRHLVTVDSFKPYIDYENDTEALERLDEIRQMLKGWVARYVPPPALPPAPYYAHPYGGTGFTGRGEELAKIDEWAGQAGVPVLAWIAIGGMGKSALAWHWTREHAEGFEGVLWWSFYDAVFQSFLNAGLAYCGGGGVDPTALKGGDRWRRLVELLNEGRYLLVLDGFERELEAYRGLKAAYQGDVPADEKPQVGDPRLECIDPQARDFLAAIGTRTELGSKVLVTSRLCPNGLTDRFREHLDGVRCEELFGLRPADAERLFRGLGVQGTRAEIEAACEPLGYHPFSLRLLAGYITEFEQEDRGDISVAPGYGGLEDDLVTRQSHILQVAYGALEPERQQFLGRLAAFRSAMDYRAVARIVERAEGVDPASPLSDDEKKALNATLKDLLTRGLLFRDEEDKYDLHPIVRRYAYERLTGKEETHARLRDYFAALPEVEEIDTEKAERLEDLEPVIELYHHTLNAGDNDAALRLFYDRLHPLYYRLSAYQTIIGLLRPLFAGGEDQPPRLTSERAQAYAANALGNAYSQAGQPRRGIPLYEVGNVIDERRDDKGNLAAGLGNLAHQQHITGGLADAAANLRRVVALGDEIGDELSQAEDRAILGWTLAYAGAYDEATRELDAAQAVLDRRYEEGGLSSFVTVTRASRAEMHLLQGDARAGLDAAQDAERWQERVARDMFPSERDFIRNAWLLGAAWRGLGNMAEAEGHLNEALTRCRRTNLVEFEAAIMLEVARLRRDEGRRAEARELAEGALLIADRAGYRLQQADAHYLLALLARDAGEIEKAREHAQEARDCAWCDGPPWAYQRTLDQAEGLLEELG